jgi:hypothetical protein
MPINPNIALGIQPVQQPNMLGQYAQVMGIKAAQQEMEGNESTRNYFSRPVSERGDPSQLLGTKQGQAAYKALNEGQIKQLEATQKRVNLIGAGAGAVLQNPTVENFRNVVENLVKNQVYSREDADKAIATIGNDPSKIPSFVTPLYRQAISAEKDLAAQTSIKTANISAGPGHRQASVAEQRLRMEQDEIDQINKIILQGRAETPSGAVTPPVVSVGGGGGGGGGAPTMPTAPATGAVVPVTGAVPKTNVLVDQVAPTAPPTSSVNALDPNAQGQQIIQQISQLIRTGPKGRQVADSLIKEYNLLNPAGKIEPDANGVLQIINERTGTSRPVLGADGKPVIAKSPFESAYSKGVGEAAATSDVALVNSAQAAVAKLQDINQTLTQLNKSDAITGFGADLLTDVERFRAQFTQDIKAGKRVADTQILNAMLGSEVFGMIQSLGIGAKGLDTPAEREYLREVMTGTVRMDKAALIKLTEIRKNVTERAIDEYNKKLDSGELNRYFETRGIKPKRIEKPASPSAAVTDSIESLKEAGLWQYMSPEDQKLWQK